MQRPTSLFFAFVLGACAGTTGSLLAEEPASQAPGGRVIDGAAALTRQAPSGKARVTELARGQNAFLARLELDGEAEVPKHRDETEEYLVVLEGGGTLLMDGRPYQLRAGNAVYMPAGAEVSYANGPQKTIAIQVFAGPAPASKYDPWEKIGG